MSIALNIKVSTVWGNVINWGYQKRVRKIYSIFERQKEVITNQGTVCGWHN